MGIYQLQPWRMRSQDGSTDIRGFSFAHGDLSKSLKDRVVGPLPNGLNGMILQVTYQFSKLHRVDCLKWLFLVGLEMGGY